MKRSNKKTYQVVVRLTPETGAQVKELADIEQISKAAWIRREILGIIAERLPE